MASIVWVYVDGHRVPFVRYDANDPEVSWDNVSALKLDICPRCSGSGEEVLFMRVHTCEVCHGSKVVSEETAQAEEKRRKEERARWSAR